MGPLAWTLFEQPRTAFASGQVGLQIAGRLSVRPGQAKVRLTRAFQARVWRSLQVLKITDAIGYLLFSLSLDS